MTPYKPCRCISAHRWRHCIWQSIAWTERQHTHITDRQTDRQTDTDRQTHNEHMTRVYERHRHKKPISDTWRCYNTKLRAFAVQKASARTTPNKPSTTWLTDRGGATISKVEDRQWANFWLRPIVSLSVR